MKLSPTSQILPARHRLWRRWALRLALWTASAWPRSQRTCGGETTGAGSLGRWFLAANVIGLLAVAIVFRFWKLDNLPGVNGDEAWYGIQALAWLEGGDPAWRTPTRNPINIFFLGPHLLLHWAAEPSFWLLRLPAVLSGLAALAVNFWLCRRVFDSQTAIVSTVILAVLPINIAYSRFSWDPAQSLLATTLVIYLAALAIRSAWQARQSADRAAHDPRLRTQLLGGATALLVAILVHPTNLFLAPLLAAPLLIRWDRELLAFVRPRPVSAAKIACWVAAATVAGLILVGGHHWFARAANRLLRPHEIADFGTLYVQLLWGVSSFRYLAGSCQGDAFVANPFNLAGLVLAGALVVLVGWYMLRQRPRVEITLAAGYLVGLVGFFLIGGPSALAPHFERYAVWMIAPAALLVARGLTWWGSRRGLQVWYVAVTIGWLWLAVFAREYFVFIQQTGGQSHRAMRTAAVEPKLAAWQVIAAEPELALGAAAAVDRPMVIATTEYWAETPLQYLSGRRNDVQVALWEADQAFPPDVQAALEEGRVRFVEFTSSTALPELQRRLAQQQQTWRETTIADYAGNPVLLVIEPEPASPPRMPTTGRELRPVGLKPAG